MRRKSRNKWLQAAVLAGAGLVCHSPVIAQQLCPPGDPYLSGSFGEACPPLEAPSPYATPPMQPQPAPPGSPDQFAPSSDPLLDQYVPSDGMPSTQPIQQPSFAPPSTSANFVSAATSPQSVAPNMIGDFFGVSGGSTLSFRTNSFHARGFYRDRSSGDVTFFPAANDAGFIRLDTPTALDIVGDATGTIPAGSSWFSYDPHPPGPPFPSQFDLSENPDETQATSAAFPGATSVSFVDGVAVANPAPGSHDEFAIFTDYLIEQVSPVTTIVLPNPGAAPGAFVGRQKIAENTSPLPRSRVFVNYSHFRDTPLTRDGVDVDRVTPGFEYAFFNNDLSIEVRAPFASTLSSDLIAGGLTSTSEIELGNITTYFKALMGESDTFSWSLGVGVTAPTADDVTIRDLDGVTIARIENEGIHLLPFLGFLYTPSERFFMQGFLQFDVDANGNPVEFTSFDEGDPTGDLTRIGRADDSTYAFIDLGIGYWIYRNRHCDGFINGLAPILELHYNAATEGNDTIRRALAPGTLNGAEVQVGRPGDLEVTNVVIGLNAVIGDSGTLTIGYAAPVAGDDQFDGEFRAFFNWFFGPEPPSSRGLIQF